MGTKYIQTWTTNAAVALKDDLYIFYYELESANLCYIISKLGKGPIQMDRRGSITISKGDGRGLVLAYLRNNTILPLAAAADPASGSVWVYYTDDNGVIHNALTKNRGADWESGEIYRANITLRGNYTFSVWFDPALSEPRIVLSTLQDSVLCEGYYQDKDWKGEEIVP